MVKRRNLRDEEGEEEEEETENLPLITSKVVEYLEPVMSRDLLCKFPDNSALGFDYSQSSLWSPLLPRNYGRALDLDSGSACRDLALELGEEKSTKTTMMKKKTKNKFLGFDVSATTKKKKTMTKKPKMDSGFCADPPKFGCFVISTKGWDGMLKAASKHFKKTKKKRDSIGDVKLLDYFKC